LLYELLNVVDI